MQVGIGNVLCKGGKKKGLWKPIIAKFSVTDAEGKVKSYHRRVTKEDEEIPAVCLTFRDDLKTLKKELKDIRKLEEYPVEGELVDQLVLRLTEEWRTFVEGKMRKRSDGMEGVTWRTVEK